MLSRAKLGKESGENCTDSGEMDFHKIEADNHLAWLGSQPTFSVEKQYLNLLSLSSPNLVDCYF